MSYIDNENYFMKILIFDFSICIKLKTKINFSFVNTLHVYM